LSRCDFAFNGEGHPLGTILAQVSGFGFGVVVGGAKGFQSQHKRTEHPSGPVQRVLAAAPFFTKVAGQTNCEQSNIGFGVVVAGFVVV
jgi:hypothetical protein